MGNASSPADAEFREESRRKVMDVATPSVYLNMSAWIVNWPVMKRAPLSQSVL